MPNPADTLCTMQAVTLQMGNILSAFANTWIAIHSLLLIVFSIKLPWWVLWTWVAFEWTVTTVLAIVGPLHIAKGGPAFYGIAGSYCWIAQTYSPWRVYLHHAFVIAAAGLCLLLFSITSLYIVTARRRAQGSSAAAFRVAKVMMLYPTVYIVTVAPLSSTRIAALAGHPWPLQATLAAGIVIALSGALNCIVYGMTRSVVSIPNPTRFFTTQATQKTRATSGHDFSRSADPGLSRHLLTGTAPSKAHSTRSHRSATDPDFDSEKDDGQQV
ncbi:hypothetical protein OIV83_000382 [Microbotryomycetes sp. JL201]|nr:hypothetical protein OIV83_000382 [Microbotryomycetes sp. JL201]